MPQIRDDAHDAEDEQQIHGSDRMDDRSEQVRQKQQNDQENRQPLKHLNQFLQHVLVSAQPKRLLSESPGGHLAAT